MHDLIGRNLNPQVIYNLRVIVLKKILKRHPSGEMENGIIAFKEMAVLWESERALQRENYYYTMKLQLCRGLIRIHFLLTVNQGD